MTTALESEPPTDETPRYGIIDLLDVSPEHLDPSLTGEGGAECCLEDGGDPKRRLRDGERRSGYILGWRITYQRSGKCVPIFCVVAIGVSNFFWLMIARVSRLELYSRPCPTLP
jgi:hypothetical protein